MAEWDDAANALPRRISVIRGALWALSQAYAGQITSDMRQNAQWRNHSGNARGGLFALPFQESDNVFGIRAAHTVEYGKWLELGIARWDRGPDIGFRERTQTGHMGYPIIANTMREYWPKYTNAAAEIVSRGHG